MRANDCGHGSRVAATGSAGEPQVPAAEGGYALAKATRLRASRSCRRVSRIGRGGRARRCGSAVDDRVSSPTAALAVSGGLSFLAVAFVTALTPFNSHRRQRPLRPSTYPWRARRQGPTLATVPFRPMRNARARRLRCRRWVGLRTSDLRHAGTGPGQHLTAGGVPDSASKRALRLAYPHISGDRADGCFRLHYPPIQRPPECVWAA